jgi:hypothetical protein
MNLPTVPALIAFLSLTVLLLAVVPGMAEPPASGLERVLARELPRLGHRNWIVVADSAYPLQAREGIKTVYIGGDQPAAVRAVLAAVDAAKHVQPNVYLDAELKHVPEAEAPGIGRYRQDLARLLGDREPRTEPHEKIIEKLDRAAETFNVLLFKTDMALPYTTVFLELDCGYWGPEKEARLRAAIEAAEP